MPIKVEGFSGGDRTDIKLPAAQQQMLEAVAATIKPMVVVLMNGSALAVKWANEHANAILEAWYPGQAGAQAIVETLRGQNKPDGRLPVTFYARIDQLPAFDDFSMAKQTYRYFKGQPLYGFGYGLSSTKFAYSSLKVSTKNLKAGEPLSVDADVTNTGHVAGDEVAELYLTGPQTAVSARYSLAGFERVPLAPGERRQVHFVLNARTLSQVNAAGARAVMPGNYSVYVGGSQPAAGAKMQEFKITGTQERERPGLGVELDETLAARYPYQRAYLPVARKLDGTLTDW